MLSVKYRLVFGLFLLLALNTAPARGQELSASPSPSPIETPTPSDTKSKPGFEKAFERLEWRSIGPSIMGGRIADVEGVAGQSESCLCRDRVRRALEDGERRCHLETNL